MSVIGLIEFLGGAVVLVAVTCFTYQWAKARTFRPDDDPSWRLFVAVVSAMTGVVALLVCVLVLMVFMTLVFPATVQ